MASNIILLPSTQGQFCVTGQPVVGTSYTMSLGSQYTVGIYGSNLTGRVYIEAALVTNPDESDWFPIVLDGQPNPYVEFDGNTQGLNSSESGPVLVSGTFYGNFTWVRARLDRDYLGLGSPSTGQIAALGFVDHVALAIGAGGIVAPPLSNASGIAAVSLESLGTGSPLFGNSSGTTDVVLAFKTLKGAGGVSIADDGSTLTVSANGVTGSNVVNFTDLQDAPNTITNYGVVVGQSNAVAFTAAPSVANTVLGWTGTGFSWVAQPTIPAVIPTVLAVQQNGSNVVAQAQKINFTGNAVAVSNVGGVATVTINQAPQTIDEQVGPSTEYVVIQYTAGSTGTLNSGDALVSNTANVAATITDVNNCLVQFTFQGYALPPSSIALMGQIVSTNQFVFQNANPSLGTRLIQSGGSAASPDLLGNFAGPVTLQVRMSDTGASAGIGQRAKAIILFRF